MKTIVHTILNLMFVILISSLPVQAAVKDHMIACDAAETKAATNSMEVAKNGVSLAISKLQSTASADVALGTKWFGIKSSSDVAVVKKNYERALGATVFTQFWCPVTNAIEFMWDPGDLAAVDASLPANIFLTPEFFKQGTTGVNSQGGTMAHELMHVIGIGLHPEIYGTKNSKALAVSKPSDARNNADNYQYFIEAILFSVK